MNFDFDPCHCEDDGKFEIPFLLLKYVREHGDLVFDDGQLVYKLSLHTDGYDPNKGTTINPEGVLGQASRRLGFG